MMRWAIVLILIALGAAAYLMFSGPRMKEQPHIRAYQAAMPPPPAGIVPVEEPSSPSLSVEASAENVARGGVYYQYYCAFCHGAAGDGRGPVGQSYFPGPPDLRSGKVRSYSDGLLLDTILKGIGHAPVMEYTLLPEHRPYLLLYVRKLASETSRP